MMMVTKKTSPLLLAGATILLSCFSVVLVPEIDHVVAWIPSSSWKHNHNVPPPLQKTKTTELNFEATRRDTDPSEDSKASIVTNDDADTSTRHHSSQHQEQEQELSPFEPTDLEERLLSQHVTMESYLSETKTATTHHPAESQTFEPSIPQTIRKASNEHENKIGHDTSTGSTPYFLESKGNGNNEVGTNTKKKEVNHKVLETSGEHEKLDVRQDTSLAKLKGASIDRAIFDFNTNLVKVLYAVISILYPTSSPSPQQADPRIMRVNSSLSPLLGTEYNEELAPMMILNFQKFYVFETVARIPYFAYLSVLHLRETLGDRGSLQEAENENFSKKSVQAQTMKQQSHKRIETMRTHYAQADNELHHLLIMESLGGNSRRVDRFLAHTMAFFYYWFVVIVYSWNEQAAYHLNEVVEDHAYKIYDEFLTVHEDELRDLPVPDIAKKYYENDFHKNPHLFEAFCAVSKGTEKSSQNKNSDSSPRKDNRPHELNSLYDVFWNIRDDEKEHWMALCNLVQYDNIYAVEESNVKSTIGRNSHSQIDSEL